MKDQSHIADFEHPAPESLLRRVKRLRAESIPYGPPCVECEMLPFIPEFSASVMLGEKTLEKGSGLGTPKRDTLEEWVGIDMSSPLAPATFDATTAYAARVDEQALRLVARREGSIGESWVQDPRWGIWTMVDPSMGEAKCGLREDMEIRGVYSHSPGNGHGGSIRLGGVIASDVGDAVRSEDLQGVKIAHYGASSAKLEDFILDREDFAEEVAGEMRF